MQILVYISSLKRPNFVVSKGETDIVYILTKGTPFFSSAGVSPL